VRNIFTCPNSKNELRDTLEDSESETLMVILQDWGPGQQRHPKQLKQALYCLVCKSLPRFLIG
jgi:hypothetical protein